MIQVTQEQIVEVLERLRDYSYHCYYTPGGVEVLRKREVESGGRRFTIMPYPSGELQVTLKDNGVECAFNWVIAPAPLTTNSEGGATLDGIQYLAQIAPDQILNDIDRAYLTEHALPFVASYVQRLSAFVFFSRMHPSSIQGISWDLALVSPPPENPA